MTEKYPIGIAGPDLNQISRDYTHLVATHERFALAMIANSWRAFQDNMHETEPVLLIVFADIAPSPDALKEVLATLKRAIVILLLPSHWAQFQGVFEQLDKVRKVFLLPAAPKEVLAYGLTLIETEIARTRAVSPLQGMAMGQSSAAVGTRQIAFVSAQGGTGRSTLAEAMGFELAARRSIRSLLFSFDLPANAPLRLGTRFAPSAAEYLQRTEGGFQDAIQTTTDGLDVIIAPPELTAYAAATRDGEQGKLHDLVNEAYKYHYAAILLDLPSGELAWMLATAAGRQHRRPGGPAHHGRRAGLRACDETADRDHRGPTPLWARGLLPGPEPAHAQIHLYRPGLCLGARQVRRLDAARAGDRGLRPRDHTRPGGWQAGCLRFRKPGAGGGHPGRNLLRLLSRGRTAPQRLQDRAGKNSSNGVAHMVMNMLDTATTMSSLSPATRQSILEQVIDQLNREFSGTTLRSPEMEERQAIQARAGALVAGGFPRRSPAAQPGGTGGPGRRDRPPGDGAGVPGPAPAACPHRPFGDRHLLQRPDPDHEEGQRALGGCRPGSGDRRSLAGAEPDARTTIKIGERSHPFGERQAAGHPPQPRRRPHQGAASGDRSWQGLSVREHPPVRTKAGAPGLAAGTQAHVEQYDDLPGHGHANG